MLHDNLNVNKNGHLTFAGKDTIELAKKYGTPLMVMDENGIRTMFRRYILAMTKSFGEGSMPLIASKALCFKEIYKIAKEEKIGIDLVSCGEMYTAIKAGFPLDNAFFHGNNKTDWDIEYGIDNGVGYFVVDNYEELDKINQYAGQKGIKQSILLRLTPGIDTHTHVAIATGKVDSKFGTPIETGQADLLIEYTLKLENIVLEGFHCHIGSQIFDIAPFCDTADIMIKYIDHIKEKFNYVINILNLGGGFGVRYVESDPIINYEKNIEEISIHIKSFADKHGIAMPRIIMEPGRSMVAANGITLYTVGSVKEIPTFKNYVSIDGGMTDNPRYALYQSAYTTLIANKVNEKPNFVATIAGRCCESGDLIAENAKIVKPVRGDILAVLVTGAYNYSMASNYNRIPRPPIVMIKDGEDRIVVKRETFEDMTHNEI
ncbi:MAG: diaminopimelate decarboxylase [Clostridia bacterium]